MASDTVTQPKGSALDIKVVPDPTDNSTESSPVSPGRRGLSLAVGTTVHMTLNTAVNSGVALNGDKVTGTLSAPVTTSRGNMLPAGTLVDATVVSSAKAGTQSSGGVLSIQLTRVGGIPVVTDVRDFNGAEGHKDVPDSAPAKGSEAVAQAGAPLDFKVMQQGKVPGVVPGVKPADAKGAGAAPTGTQNSPTSSQPPL